VMLVTHDPLLSSRAIKRETGGARRQTTDPRWTRSYFGATQA
jgi:hypothetical protein